MQKLAERDAHSSAENTPGGCRAVDGGHVGDHYVADDRGSLEGTSHYGNMDITDEAEWMQRARIAAQKLAHQMAIDEAELEVDSEADPLQEHGIAEASPASSDGVSKRETLVSATPASMTQLGGGTKTNSMDGDVNSEVNKSALVHPYPNKRICEWHSAIRVGAHRTSLGPYAYFNSFAHLVQCASGELVICCDFNPATKDHLRVSCCACLSSHVNVDTCQL